MQVPPYDRPAAATRAGSTSGWSHNTSSARWRSQRLRSSGNDAGHRGADEIPVAVVLVGRHPVGALAEAAQVGREHHVAERRERVRVVVAGTARLDAAHQRLAGPVTVDREHGRAGRGVAARVRHEEIRGHRHRRLGVEHDAVPRVVAAVDRFGRPRDRAGRAPDAHRGSAARSARVRARHASSSARRASTGPGRVDAFELQAPVRPVGEVAGAGAHAGSPSAQPRPPERWRRYVGDSHAAGK